LAGVSLFEPLAALLASSPASLSPSPMSLARVAIRVWRAPPLLPAEEMALVEPLSSASESAALPLGAMAWAGAGCCTPAMAAARDCEIKASEASVSSLAAFVLLPDEALLGVAPSAEGSGRASAAFCAAAACDCAIVCRKVADVASPCCALGLPFAPFALADLLAACDAFAVLDWDCEPS